MEKERELKLQQERLQKAREAEIPEDKVSITHRGAAEMLTGVTRHQKSESEMKEHFSQIKQDKNLAK